MMNPELLERIRQQFDYAPFPSTPLEDSPRNDRGNLFNYSLVTPYYLHHRQVVDTRDRSILDVGCGTGMSTLKLAEANPGAQILGIDISEESVNLARKRLQYHGSEAEVAVYNLYDLPSLNQQFDYINCDEVLYLLPDPATALQIMGSVLKADGILHANFHDRYQQRYITNAQTLFGMLELLDENPQDFEIDIVVETMRSLRDTSVMKRFGWSPSYEDQREDILHRYLTVHDQGINIPEMFSLLKQAGLHFTRMVNGRQWQLIDLFQDPDHLPDYWQENLDKLSVEQQLYFFELLMPIHRLLDMWCSPAASASSTSINWDTATIHLHPQLQDETVLQAIQQSCATQKSVNLSPFFETQPSEAIAIDSQLAATLLPLWEGPQSFHTLSQRYSTLNPLDPITLAPVTPADIAEPLQQQLSRLEALPLILAESGT
ncbi:class I SAM-dependent methyltransferase [Leptolyngbya sp. AN02str]|uniref:class I SAM-dependent methyltransferase n=1 Tax=Leptolyngbya sp. AN02str TaxID=3423363 RepID=UPI003D3239BA